MSNHNPFSSNPTTRSAPNPWTTNESLADYESNESSESSPYYDTPIATRTRPPPPPAPVLPSPPVPPRHPNARNEYYRNEIRRNESDYLPRPTFTAEPPLPQRRSVHFSNPGERDLPPHSTPRPPPSTPLYTERGIEPLQNLSSDVPPSPTKPYNTADYASSLLTTKVDLDGIVKDFEALDLGGGVNMENFIEWKREAMAAARKYPKGWQEVILGQATRPSGAHEDANDRVWKSWEAAREAARSFFIRLAGKEAFKIIKHVEEEKMLKTLSEHFDRPATNSERAEDWKKLREHQLISHDFVDLQSYYFNLKDLQKKLNRSYERSRLLHPKLRTHAHSPALADDVLRDLYIDALPPSLRSMCYVSLRHYIDLEELHLELVRLTRDENYNSSRESSMNQYSSSSASAYPARSNVPSSFTAPSSSAPRFPSSSSTRNPPPRPQTSSSSSSRYSPVKPSQPQPASAHLIPHSERWPHGVFKSGRGIRFRSPRGSCYGCWQPGHISRDCPNRHVAQDMKTKMLQEEGINISPSHVNALVASGNEEIEAIAGAIDPESPWFTNGLGEYARFAMPEDGGGALYFSPLFENEYPSEVARCLNVTPGGYDFDSQSQPLANARVAHLVPDIPFDYDDNHVFTVTLRDQIPSTSLQSSSSPALPHSLSSSNDAPSLLSRLGPPIPSKSPSSLATPNLVSPPLIDRLGPPISSNPPLKDRVTPAEYARRAASSTDRNFIFILDTGSSLTFTRNLSLLHDVEWLAPERQISVGGAFGAIGKAVARGKLVGEFNLPDGTISTVTFPSAYFVPNLGHDLLSGYALFQLGYSFHPVLDSPDSSSTVVMIPKGSSTPVASFDLHKASRSVVAKARWIPPTYSASSTPTLPTTPSPVRLSPSSPSPLVRSADALRSAVGGPVWHGRCGHAGDDKLRLMAKGKVATGLEYIGSLSTPFCEACAKGKFSRAPVPKVAESRATEPLGRLHSDAWGPAPTVGILRKERHVLSVEDDYSRYIWAEGIQSRDMIPGKVIEWIREMELQEGKLVKRFRNDGAAEYVGNTMKGFFKAKGIVQEVTIPYEHQQNGVVERSWRTLLNMARCSLFASGLPSSFLFLAIEASVHVYNRLPHSANDNVSPYERFFGTPPDVSHLRTFGCVAYVWEPEPKRTKEQPRTRRCAFVGYLPKSAGFRFFDLETRSFLVASPRQVLWMESTFPSHRNPSDLKAELEEVAKWNPFEDVGIWEKAVTDQGGEEETDQGGEEETDQGGAAPSKPSLLADDPPAELQAPIIPRPSTPKSITPRPDFVSPVPSTPQTPSSSPRIPSADDFGKPPSPLPPPPNDGYEYLLVKKGKNPGKLENVDPSNILQGGRSTRRRQPQQSSKVVSILQHANLDVDLDENDPLVQELAEIDFESEEVNVLLASAPSPDSPSIKQALNGPDRAEWLSAVSVELEAMKARGVFDSTPVDLPPGGKGIPLKWVLLIKRDENGAIIKYKARLVARGDLQRPGIDFDQVFSPTVRFSSILVVFALAALNKWDIKQFDVSTAFLHASLPDHTELFIRQIPGFADPAHPHRVHRLRKSLYGLRQAGREWSETFLNHLKAIGFEQSPVDNSLFVRWRNGKVAIVPIHVDDGQVVGNDDLGEVIRELNERLDNSVKEEKLSLFLNIKIRRQEDGTVTLDQAHYVDKLLERFGFDDETDRSYTTPFDPKTNILPRSDSEPLTSHPYRELLGALIYLSTSTRPDIAYSISIASRFANSPADRHWKILKRILRYLRHTKSLGLRFSPGQSSSLSGWTDADHAADPLTRRSISGWVFTLGGAAIAWQSKRQATVAISSTEAEYLALSAAVRQAIYFRNLLSSLGFPPSGPTIIHVDNRSAIILADHPAHHERTKHIAVHAHFSREKVASGEVSLKWTPTNSLTADVLTKGLQSTKHYQFVTAMGLFDVQLEGVCWRLVLG